MRVTARTTTLVKTRAAGRCEYCHAPQLVIGQTFHIDHVVPRAAGGTTAASNLCLACAHCNLAKRDAVRGDDPRTKQVVPFFNPRTQVWEEHFRWSPSWQRIIGRTPTGRATVMALAINDSLLRRARPFWRITGLIP